MRERVRKAKIVREHGVGGRVVGLGGGEADGERETFTRGSIVESGFYTGQICVGYFGVSEGG